MRKEKLLHHFDEMVVYLPVIKKCKIACSFSCLEFFLHYFTTLYAVVSQDGLDKKVRHEEET